MKRCQLSQMKGYSRQLTLATIFLLLVEISSSGCAYYSMSGSLPPHIKTVAVPLFENDTLEYGLKEKLTDSVIDRLVADNTLKVVDAKIADSIVIGKITAVREEPFTYASEEKAKEFKVRIFVQVVYRDLKKKADIWEAKLLEGWGVYDVSGGGLNEREKGIETALKMISDEIVNRTVAGW